MIKTSTTENLILYLFNETGMSDSVLIQREIDTDPEIKNEFDSIKRAVRYIDKALIDPSPECLNKIMRYAAESA